MKMKIHTKVPFLLIALDLLAALALIGAFLLVLWYAPLELTMGRVQKVFYFHVAAGWTGMLGFLVATVSAVVFLKNGSLKWDSASLAGAEIGMVFMALCIVSGSIWARPIWNTWWTWDPRLTTALIMELIYSAYFILRSGIDDPRRRAKLASIYAIVGFASVPLTFVSIRIFRTIHPVIVGGTDSSAAGAFAMTARMQTAFFSSLAAFSILFAALFWHRLRLELLRNQVESTQQLIVSDEE